MSAKTILYVEDNELNRKIVRDLLRRTSYRLIEAPDGEAGVMIALEQRPDLILMDVQLPKRSGRRRRRWKAPGSGLALSRKFIELHGVAGAAGPNFRAFASSATAPAWASRAKHCAARESVARSRILRLSVDAYQRRPSSGGVSQVGASSGMRGRELLDAAPVSVDRRAHRATRVASDVSRSAGHGARAMKREWRCGRDVSERAARSDQLRTRRGEHARGGRQNDWLRTCWEVLTSWPTGRAARRGPGRRGPRDRPRRPSASRVARRSRSFTAPLI